MSVLLDAALGYARPVFPVRLDKSPYTARGFKDASKDRATIRRWWARWPDAGIGTPTGPGWFVLDDDTDGRALAVLVAAHGPLPPTVEAVTPRPGRHLYLRGEATNSDTALPAGLNVRGVGGYVLLPPSPHANGGRYEWRTAPDEAPIARAPAWLLALLRVRTGGGEHQAPAELVPHGRRHPYLCDFAVRLLRAGVTDRARIVAHLRCEFELSCVRLPPPAPGYFESLANWAANSEIARGERAFARLNASQKGRRNGV